MARCEWRGLRCAGGGGGDAAGGGRLFEGAEAVIGRAEEACGGHDGLVEVVLKCFEGNWLFNSSG